MLVTGHTGFKGSWLALSLHRLGASVFGFALDPRPGGIFELARVGELVDDRRGDVGDASTVADAMAHADPEVVLHLAAQAFVHDAYEDPAATYRTNVMGTVNVLDALKAAPRLVAAVIVTSDKVYEAEHREQAFAEGDPLGGVDPYSSSKACADIVSRSWARAGLVPAGAALAVARAGNVIGGGDQGSRRLMPDIVRAHERDEVVRLRHPEAVRPWQHVLDCVSGYLALGQRLASGTPTASAYNFGPADDRMISVAELAETAFAALGSGSWVADTGSYGVETSILRLDSQRARDDLGWRPRLDARAAVEWTVGWHREQLKGRDPLEVSLEQLGRYQELP